MMQQIKVYTAPEAIKCLTSSENTVEVQQRANEKNYTGSTFYDLKFKLAGDRFASGWFSSTDPIIISTGCADPSDKTDKRNEYGTPTSITITETNAPELSRLLRLVDSKWIPAFDLFKGTLKKKITKQAQTIMMDTYGAQSTKSGESLPEPIVRLKINFGKYPNNYPIVALRGQQKTRVHDASKAKKVGKSVDYELATVKDDNGNDVPLNESNAYKFITAGSVIRYIRIAIPSVCVSSVGVTVPITVDKIVLEHIEAVGFSDDPIPDDLPSPVVDVATMPDDLKDDRSKIQSNEPDDLASLLGDE